MSLDTEATTPGSVRRRMELENLIRRIERCLAAGINYRGLDAKADEYDYRLASWLLRHKPEGMEGQSIIDILNEVFNPSMQQKALEVEIAKLQEQIVQLRSVPIFLGKEDQHDNVGDSEAS